MERQNARGLWCAPWQEDTGSGGRLPRRPLPPHLPPLLCPPSKFCPPSLLAGSHPLFISLTISLLLHLHRRLTDGFKTRSISKSDSVLHLSQVALIMLRLRAFTLSKDTERNMQIVSRQISINLKLKQSFNHQFFLALQTQGLRSLDWST